MIAVNARYLVHRTTGMQRYAREVVSRIECETELVRPRRRLEGALGHAWEQTILPARAAGRTLWSPCNTGPIASARHVVTVHDIAPLDHPEWYTPSFVRLYRLVIGPVVRRATTVLAVSEFTRGRLIDRFGLEPNKVLVTGEGAADVFRPPVPNAVDEVRHRLGLGDRRYFLAVGNVTPRKNLSHLVRAFGLSADGLDDVELVLAGARAATNAFPALPLDRSRRAIMLDYVDDQDLPSLMAGSLAVVVPSHYEGFGLPALEAMSCGAPVIAARSTALPEVVGQAGLLTEPDDDESLADALVRIATDADLRDRLRAAGMVRAHAFTWERAAEVTHRALTDVAG